MTNRENFGRGLEMANINEENDTIVEEIEKPERTKHEHARYITEEAAEQLDKFHDTLSIEIGEDNLLDVLRRADTARNSCVDLSVKLKTALQLAKLERESLEATLYLGFKSNNTMKMTEAHIANSILLDPGIQKMKKNEIILAGDLNEVESIVKITDSRISIVTLKERLRATGYWS